MMSTFSSRVFPNSMFIKVDVFTYVSDVSDRDRKTVVLGYVPKVFITLRPESSENIPILLQEADPYFSNQNGLRNPKMGSKQSVTGPTH